MPRSRAALLPLAPSAPEEDEGTWMLTFSDLVLLLLAFVALGVLMERAEGTHVLTARPRAAAAPPAGRPEPFALVDGPRTVAPPATTVTAPQADPGAAVAPPPPARVEPVARVAPPAPRRADPADARLRTLAARLELAIAAEGLPGLGPVVVEAGAITVIVDGGATRRLGDVAGVRPRVAPAPLVLVSPTAPVSSTHDRALARAARLAHELIADESTLVLHAVPAGHPARLEIRRAG